MEMPRGYSDVKYSHKKRKIKRELPGIGSSVGKVTDLSHQHSPWECKVHRFKSWSTQAAAGYRCTPGRVGPFSPVRPPGLKQSFQANSPARLEQSFQSDHPAWTSPGQSGQPPGRPGAVVPGRPTGLDQSRPTDWTGLVQPGWSAWTSPVIPKYNGPKNFYIFL